jgi:hypothetical protein
MLASRDAVMAVLGTVMDPEVPVISVVELGIIRDAEVHDGVVSVTVTPTYSGCPAMREIEDDIRSALLALARGGAGADGVRPGLDHRLDRSRRRGRSCGRTASHRRGGQSRGADHAHAAAGGGGVPVLRVGRYPAAE